MPWTLYDYVDDKGRNDFRAWWETLQKPERAKLKRRLKELETNGPALAPQMLAGPLRGYPHIYKLKINGKVAVRPLLCKGPIDNETEFTLLKGALEVGNEWEPPNAPSDAVARRGAVIADPKNRRTPHVAII